MVYIKSTVVGIAAVFLFAVIWLIVFSMWANRCLPPDTHIGIDVVSVAKSLAKQSKPQVIMLLVFAAAFYWEFRRASK